MADRRYTDNYNLDLYNGDDKPNLRDQYESAMTKIDGKFVLIDNASNSTNNNLFGLNQRVVNLENDVIDVTAQLTPMHDSFIISTQRCVKSRKRVEIDAAITISGALSAKFNQEIFSLPPEFKPASSNLLIGSKLINVVTLEEIDNFVSMVYSNTEARPVIRLRAPNANQDNMSLALHCVYYTD